MSKPILSKSTFIRSLQCLKSLYLYKNYYKQRDKPSNAQQAIFNRGHQVGISAQQLFKGGVDASIGVKKRGKEALLKTLNLLEQGHKIIYEASFQFEEVWVIADAIVLSDKGWHVFEVKSSVAISETYMNDAALQYYVINNALLQLNQLPIDSMQLVHVNPHFVKNGSLNLDSYFVKKNVTQYCKDQTAWVNQKIVKAKLTLENGKIPAIDIGPHCKQPYVCDFLNTCHRHITEPMRFSFPQHFVWDQNAKQIALSILVSKPAMPVFDGCSPYQYLPYGFAAKSTNSRFIHQFLADANQNPTIAFADMLYQTISDCDIIWVDEFATVAHLFQYLNTLNLQNQQWDLLSEKLVGIESFFNSSHNFDINLAAQKLQVTVPINTLVPHVFAASDIFLEMQKTQDLFSVTEQTEQLQKFNKEQLQIISDITAVIERFSHSNYV